MQLLSICATVPNSLHKYIILCLGKVKCRRGIVLALHCYTYKCTFVHVATIRPRVSSRWMYTCGVKVASLHIARMVNVW